MLDLINPKLSSEEALRRVSMSKREREHPLVRVPQGLHFSIFSPSGGGKGVSFVVPYLRSCSDSCVVNDLKNGENARLTAAFRERCFGHRCILLDPYGIVTKSHGDTLNALDLIDKNDPEALDRCAELAAALVIRDPNERERHFADKAEAFIAAVIAVVVVYGEPNVSRSLQTVREIFSSPARLDMALQAMLESDHLRGMLASQGGQLMHSIERERASTLSTVSRYLRFLASPAIADNTSSSSFDLADLRSGKLTIYYILPTEFLLSGAGLLRTWIVSTFMATFRGGLQESEKVHCLFDEAASIGPLPMIDHAIDKGRAFGLRLRFFYQSPGQLKRCFPDGQDATFLANVTQVYAGINDLPTAEMVSARLGESTVIVESGGRSGGTSRQATYDSQSPHSSSGNSDTSSTNWSQQARKLLQPSEVLQLPPRTAISFVPGMPPIRTEMIRYYEEEWLGEQPSAIRRFGAAVSTLLKSAAACAASLGTMWFFARMLQTEGAGAFTKMLFEY